jgi:methyl-accepting chemotaxis protein
MAARNWWTGIGQINQAIAQMDQVTQQNAALVEQAAAASGAMQDQAAQLAQTVSVFKLDGAIAPATPLPVVPPGARAAARAVAPQRAAAQPRQVAAPPATLRRPPAAAGNGSPEWEEF